MVAAAGAGERGGDAGCADAVGDVDEAGELFEGGEEGDGDCGWCGVGVGGGVGEGGDERGQREDEGCEDAEVAHLEYEIFTYSRAFVVVVCWVVGCVGEGEMNVGGCGLVRFQVVILQATRQGTKSLKSPPLGYFPSPTSDSGTLR